MIMMIRFKMRYFVIMMAVVLLLLFVLAFRIISRYNLAYVLKKKYEPRRSLYEQKWFQKYIEHYTFTSVPVWPEDDPGDRVLHQLLFVPREYGRSSTRLKKILLFDRIYIWAEYLIQVFPSIKEGREIFQRFRCLVDMCSITQNISEASDADAIIFRNGYTGNLEYKRRENHQIWILYVLESPFQSRSFFGMNKVFNWTSTYRHDSDIPILYSKFILYDPNVTTLPLAKNYASNKIHKVAWFVSNCQAYNNRMEYAKNLSKYIEVDIYGKCGTKSCPRSQANYCLNKIGSEYKFYLAFENSNCRDYITEKFFLNALSYDILPIVMGAPKEDYERVAPYNSFIHVDDFESPKHLADYLHLLDNNDTMYNEYFRWKGTGEIMYDDFYLCRVCAMLHDKQPPKVYDNLEKWWRGPGICTTGSWKNR